MIASIKFFMFTIQIVALLTAVASIYIIGFKKIDGVKDDGKGEPIFFSSQFTYCKWATFILLIIGWLFGDTSLIADFMLTCIIIGVSWGILGIIFMITLLYSLLTKAEKSIRDYLRKYATGNISFGIFITLLSWLLWG